jgi:hypothetical protein
MEQEPEPVWKQGDLCLTNKRTDRLFINKVGETPSRFLSRVIKDMDSHGCSTWSYLKMEMGDKTLDHLVDAIVQACSVRVADGETYKTILDTACMQPYEDIFQFLVDEGRIEWVTGKDGRLAILKEED